MISISKNMCYIITVQTMYTERSFLKSTVEDDLSFKSSCNTLPAWRHISVRRVSTNNEKC